MKIFLFQVLCKLMNVYYVFSDMILTINFELMILTVPFYSKVLYVHNSDILYKILQGKTLQISNSQNNSNAQYVSLYIVNLNFQGKVNKGNTCLSNTTQWQKMGSFRLGFSLVPERMFSFLVCKLSQQMTMIVWYTCRII